MLYQMNTLMRIVRFVSNFGVGFVLGLTAHNFFPNFGIDITF